MGISCWLAVIAILSYGFGYDEFVFGINGNLDIVTGNSLAAFAEQMGIGIYDGYLFGFACLQAFLQGFFDRLLFFQGGYFLVQVVVFGQAA